jgi:hypothetical protein
MKSKAFTAIIATAAGAALLAAAAMPAQAAREINIYGASAQYLFWNDLADNFLLSKGCSNIRQAQFEGTGPNDSNYRKHGITLGTACTEYGGNDVIIRYSAKASYDGIFAIQGDVRDGNQPLPAVISWASPNPNSCANNFERSMADETTISGSVVGARKCVRVNVGASDVAGKSFTQESHGANFGPNGGAMQDRVFPAKGIWTDGTWKNYPTDQNVYHLESNKPVVVPFGFFGNKAIKVQRCTAGTNAGEMCTDATQAVDCPGSTCAAPAELDNVTRPMAVNIFSGQVWYWTDFGAGFSVRNTSGGELAADIVACMRHAGSGTHATLDYAVVKGNGWGALLAPTENSGGPTIWFNDGSGDEMKCVNGTIPGFTTGSDWGAIGYADADQSVSSYTKTKAMKYQGMYGTRVNIRNGMYDFWAHQWLYYPGLEAPVVEPNYATTHPVYEDLVAYASDPANIPSTKAKFWATANEMVYGKENDQSYPRYTGATNPQTP